MDLCIVDYSVEIPTRCSFVIEFIIPKFLKAQHVSSGTPLIIRSSKLYLQPLVYTPIWWPAVTGCTFCAWQRPPTTRPTTFHVWKTGGCQCSFGLLMMDGVSSETCWASYRYGIIKFWYIVAFCWIFLYEVYYDARIYEQQEDITVFQKWA